MWELTRTNGKGQGCSNPDLMHPFLGVYDGQGDIASLLTTDTGDAGRSRHVARRFFQLYFHDKYCYLYIIEWTTVPL